MTRTEEVDQFLEGEPGVYFPSSIHGSLASTDIQTQHTTRITDLKINQPLPPEQLTIRYPNGVVLVDGTRDKIYHVDPQGNRSSEEKTLRRGAPPPVPATETAAEPITAETRQDAFPWIHLLVPIALVLLLLGLVMRWRTGRQQRAS